MVQLRVVSRQEWLKERKRLLVEEKEFTRQRDKLSARRQSLPWVEIVKDYQFGNPDGIHTLADLFRDHSQLIIYHFMMGDDWQAGCPSCSMWADGFNGNNQHFAARDCAFAAVSSASVEQIEKYKQRMGWEFNWYSCANDSFNQDFGVSFTPQQLQQGEVEYNYRSLDTQMQELPGISVFCKQSGSIYHTYSTYSRGLDHMNVVYQYLDLLPKGRDESELDFTMAWVRRHDEYE